MVAQLFAVLSFHLLSKTTGINYINIFCILKRKNKKPCHPWILIPSRKSQTLATTKRWCVGPHRVHEFQMLVRNYLFCWTLAGNNQPLSGWYQLRASVMQEEYFKPHLTPSLLCPLPASLPSSPLTLPPTTFSVPFLFNCDSLTPLKVVKCNESNGTCVFSAEGYCLSSDFPSSHGISQQSGVDNKQNYHYLNLLSPSVFPNVFPICSPHSCQSNLLKFKLNHVIPLLKINPWLLLIAQRIKAC